MRHDVRYRRSPCVVASWNCGQLVFENYATHMRVAAAPITCQVLDWFSEWRTIRDVVDIASAYDGSSIASAVRQLARTTLLQRSNRKPHRVETLISQWSEWNPAAGFFHFSTKDVRFKGDREQLREYFLRLADLSPMPSSVKRYPQAPSIPLPEPCQLQNFEQLLLERRTWRRFASSPLAVEKLSHLLWQTFRIHGWIDFYGLGELAVKTSPSGGARHPIETYVVALNIQGLKRGIYHYAADKHALEWLRSIPSAAVLRSLTPTQDWCSQAAAMLLMTAIFERSRWKYRFARAYRAILLDAGHVGQTFCLAATNMGLAPYSTMALADSKIERLLGIDGVNEGIIYVAGVGLRPNAYSPSDKIRDAEDPIRHQVPSRSHGNADRLE